MYFGNSYLYYIPIALQAICVIHCMRKGNALFLLRAGREQEAKQVLDAMIYEGGHLSSRERRANQLWINNAKDEARKMNTVSK